MKKRFLLSSRAWMAVMVAGAGLMIVMASCSKKNDPTPEPVGEAKVRFVNTVQGSEAQDSYVNGAKTSLQAVAYGNASDYLTITSGANSFGFYNAGSATANATSDAYTFPIGISGTVFYAQSQNGPLGIIAVGDDMSSTAAGKAKVRFINLNKFSGSNAISVSIVGQTTPLIPSLIYLDINNAVYQSVDPGVKFKFAAAGVTDAPELDPGLVAGKNYTIWVDGSSATQLSGHVILQN
jgi:hypothetical protein